MREYLGLSPYVVKTISPAVNQKPSFLYSMHKEYNDQYDICLKSAWNM